MKFISPRPQSLDPLVINITGKSGLLFRVCLSSQAVEMNEIFCTLNESSFKCNLYELIRHLHLLIKNHFIETVHIYSNKLTVWISGEV